MCLLLVSLKKFLNAKDVLLHCPNPPWNLIYSSVLLCLIFIVILFTYFYSKIFIYFCGGSWPVLYPLFYGSSLSCSHLIFLSPMECLIWYVNLSCTNPVKISTNWIENEKQTNKKALCFPLPEIFMVYPLLMDPAFSEYHRCHFISTQIFL